MGGDRRWSGSPVLLRLGKSLQHLVSVTGTWAEWVFLGVQCDGEQRAGDGTYLNPDVNLDCGYHQPVNVQPLKVPNNQSREECCCF